MRRFYFVFAVIFLSLLFNSCQSYQDDEDTIQSLIRQGRNDEAASRFQYQYDINEKDSDGNTALHVAAEQDAHELITRFVTVGANTEIKNNNGDTPLHVALKKDNFNSVQTLAALGANIFATDNNNVSAIELGFAKDEKYYDAFITTKSGEIRDVNGQSIVHYFVKTENEKAVKKSIQKNLPLSIKDNYGATPLDIALESKDLNEKSVQIAADLILGGAELVNSDYSYFQNAVKQRNMDYRYDDGQTPLHKAAIGGHTNIAKYVLNNGAKTQNQDSTGTTPLHESVRYGRTDIAQMLLQGGADINAEDSLGKTPIMIIIPDEVQYDMYSLLLSYGADVAHKDTYGDTVLHTSEMTNFPVELLQMLVNFGAPIDERNKEGITPLALAIDRHITDHIRFYVENGADIHSEDNKNTTPLTASLKTDDLLPSLLTYKNIMSRDSFGNTVLHVALKNNAGIKKVQYILDMMKDVNARNVNGESALYIAVQKNQKQIGEMLLARGADIFSANNQNFSPLRLALQPNNPAANWLITSQTIHATDGYGNTPLHYVSEWGMEEAVLYLLTRGANPIAKNANGEIPLFSAVKADNANLISNLIVGGSNIFARDNLGSTPLHTAVRWNAGNSANYLISHGIEIDAQNMAGKSALAEAVASGNTHMTNLLLENGANVNLTDNSGRTILIDSIKSDSLPTVKLLLDYGANPNIQEINGRSVYHEAAAYGNREIIALIRNAGGNALTRDKNGNTPFSLSLDKSNAVILEVLGKDKKIADSDGNTPIHLLVEETEVPLKTLELLVQKGFDLDSRNAKGFTQLAIAVTKNDIESASILLANGANPFIATDKEGKCAASIALENKSDEIVSAMAQYAGTKKDIQGNTLMHYAAKVSPTETIEALIKKGLDPNAKNITGETPYQTAVRWQRDDVSFILQMKQ